MIIKRLHCGAMAQYALWLRICILEGRKNANFVENVDKHCFTKKLNIEIF